MNEIDVRKISTNYTKINNEKYNSLLALAANERGISSYKERTKSAAYKKGFEIINSINYKKKKSSTDSLKCFYRSNIEFENTTEKLVFINNFLFDTDNFIHAIDVNNIEIDDIELLINKIKEKKQMAKVTKEYNLNIENIINIKDISNYYNFNNKEAIINMIIELYTMRNELFKTNNKIKKIVKI